MGHENPKQTSITVSKNTDITTPDDLNFISVLLTEAHDSIIIQSKAVLVGKIGEIQKITCDGPDRFDANAEPHYHFTCTHCGAVEDLDFDPEPNFEHLTPKNFAGKIESITLSFSGVCQSCTKKS